MHQGLTRFVIEMLFGALGTWMGMFSQSQYDKLQAYINERYAITYRLMEVVNTQE